MPTVHAEARDSATRPSAVGAKPTAESPRPAEPTAAPVLAPCTPQQVMQLQRTIGNRAVGQLLRAAPAIQRDLHATHTTAAGTLSVDFKSRSPLLNGSRASESGVVSFKPGDGAPDTPRIYLEQLAKTEMVRDGLPDLDDLALDAQRTQADEHGAEAGYFVDQVVPEVRARVESLVGSIYLASPTRHAYGNTGEIAKEPLHVVVEKVLAAKQQGTSPREAQIEAHLSTPQLRSIYKWATGARRRGFLGETIDAVTVAKALVLTASADESEAEELAAATGIDAGVWNDVRISTRRAREENEHVTADQIADQMEPAELRRDAYGSKKGAARQPASLYDTPSSKHPIKYDFKTAPIDAATGQDMGLYARWGFEIDMHPEGERVRIKPDSEHAQVVETRDSSYGATARQARQRFDTYWQSEHDDYANPVAPPLPPQLLQAPVQQEAQAPEAPVGVELPDLPPVVPDFQVTGYAAGQLGVFFVTTGALEFVAKPLRTAYNEAVAYELGRALGIPQPTTIIIGLAEGGPAAERAAAVVQAIMDSDHADEYRQNFGDRPPPFLMVMDKVTGTTLESLGEDDEEVDYGDPTALLNDIASIAAFDLLLFYQDRTSIVGMGNLANIIVADGPDGRKRGVAIDQRVNVISGENGWGQRPLKVLEKKLEDVAEGGTEVVDGLWDDIPQGLRTALGTEVEGKRRLGEALKRALKRVAERLSDETIDRIAQEQSGIAEQAPQALGEEALKHDRVDVAALKRALSEFEWYFE